MNNQKKKQLFLLGGGALALLLAAIVLVAVLGGGSGKQYEKHYSAAEGAFLRRDYDTALSELDKALNAEVTEEAYLLMADVYYAQGDPEQAIQVLYLGYSRVGGDTIADMLDRLKRETETEEPTPAENGGVTVAGRTFAPDTTAVVVSGKNLGNEDFAALCTLTELESLSVSDNAISDLTPVAGLKKLTSLQISNNAVSDLSALSGLSGLRTLYIDGNPVRDLTPLYRLGSLKTLSMKDVSITAKDLSALKEALPSCSVFADAETEEVTLLTLGGRTFSSDVTELVLGGLELTDISALSACKELVRLDLRDNKITDLSPLVELQNLEWLCLWNNEVEDLTPLMSLTKLRYLDVDTNRVTDIVPLEYLTGLEELWLNNNSIRGFDTLEKLAGLTRLGLRNTGIDDAQLDVLFGLRELRELELEDNEDVSANKVEALREALPKCTISHSARLPEEPDDARDAASEQEMTEADDVAAANGVSAATALAGTGSGYAILWQEGDAISSGIREGFLDQAESLGMNVVLDSGFPADAGDFDPWLRALQTLGADAVVLAADDDATARITEQAAALGYAPAFTQVY